MIIYVDGVFDMFHRGHLECFKQIKSNFKDCQLIVGIVSDKNCKSYKRLPIINEEDRYEIVKSIKYVDSIIENCPLLITKEFISKNNIDLVVHGFSSNEDYNKQYEFFKDIIIINKFKRIEYYNKTSTTNIIKKILKYYNETK
jgi:choline-phosphate cytidylyltransferase